MAGNGGHLLDVASGSSGHLGVAEDHGLSGSTAKGPHDPGPQLGPTHKHLLFIGGKPGEALGLTAGNQGDLLDRVMGLDQGAHQGMANFVIGNQTLAAAIGEGFALHAGDDPIDGVINFGEGCGVLAAAGREDGGFVEQVGEVCTRETRGAAGHGLQAHIGGQLFIAGMHLQHRDPALDVGHINLDLAVETAWTQQG